MYRSFRRDLHGRVELTVSTRHDHTSSAVHVKISSGLNIELTVQVGCCCGAGRVRRPFSSRFSSRASAFATDVADAGAVTLDSM